MANKDVYTHYKQFHQTMGSGVASQTIVQIDRGNATFLGAKGYITVAPGAADGYGYVMFFKLEDASTPFTPSTADQSQVDRDQEAILHVIPIALDASQSDSVIIPIDIRIKRTLRGNDQIRIYYVMSADNSGSIMWAGKTFTLLGAGAEFNESI